MEPQNIVLVIVLIALSLIIIKVISKIVIKLALITILIFGAAYFLLFQNSSEEEFILVRMQERYCQEGNTTKCECIIETLLADISQDYPGEELQKLQKNRMKSIQVVYASLNENKEAIKSCLRSKNAVEEWEEFLEDIKENSFDKYKNLLESLKQ